jgi:hypothetical protein
LVFAPVIPTREGGGGCGFTGMRICTGARLMGEGGWGQGQLTRYYILTYKNYESEATEGRSLTLFHGMGLG